MWRPTPNRSRRSASAPRHGPAHTGAPTALLWLGLLWLGCDGSDDTSPEREAPHGMTDGSHFGGVLVELADHSAELVVHESGEVHLHVPEALDSASVTVTLPADDGSSHSVAMRWEDRIQGFVGLLEGAPAVGDAEVLVIHAGHLTRVTATVQSLLPQARHHGSVVAVGSRTVEVVMESDGHAYAYVLDEPARSADLALTLNVEGDDGQLHPLALRWDEDAHHYVGLIEGLRPVAGPLEVIAIEHGRESLGRGSLLDVQLARPDALRPNVPSDFRLDLPSLGESAPARIMPAELPRRDVE